MHPAFAPSRASDPRRLLARLWAEPDTRSTLIGLLGVLLIHLLVWLVAPHVLHLDTIDVPVRPHATAKQFNIELVPETFAKAQPKPRPPQRFLEANPDAPDNKPDKADYFSDRNQQLAQEKPNPDGKSDRPATEGKNEQQTTQIVDGRLNNQQDRPEPPPQPIVEHREQNATAPRLEQNPLPGFEKKQGDDQGSFGSGAARLPDNIRPIPERIEGIKDAPAVESTSNAFPVIDRNNPQPRPQVVRTSNTRPAFLKNEPGTSKVGPHGANTNWSQYGEYLRRMTEAVQQEWEKILISRNTSPPPGTFVVVKFILDSEGKVPRIVGVENHSSELGANACVAAITGRAPYGPWPDDMKAALGEQDEMTFVFQYMSN